MLGWFAGAPDPDAGLLGLSLINRFLPELLEATDRINRLIRD